MLPKEGNLVQFSLLHTDIIFRMDDLYCLKYVGLFVVRCMISNTVTKVLICSDMGIIIIKNGE